MRRLLGITAILLLVLLPAGRAAAADSLCFANTQQCLSGRFRSYWEQNGGLAVFGYPVSPVEAERNPDTGRTYLTVWLERARFELHPELKAPYDLLQGRLGADSLVGTSQSGSVAREPAPLPGCLWFKETGHNVCDQDSTSGFMTYWQTHGINDGRLDAYGRSLALFGLPLTAPQTVRNSSGELVKTQWFERARFEWHPDQPAAFRVLLGRLGSEQFQGATNTSGVIGIITRGPMCPVTIAEQPCPDQPVQTDVVIMNATTMQDVAVVASGADGYFVASLPPGSYTLVLRLPNGRPDPRARPVTVTVVANQFATAAIHLDTGIR